MTELAAGANLALPAGAVTVRLPGPFDLAALVLGPAGKVAGDADFVFYNQPTAPGVRLAADALTVDPTRLRPGAARVVVVASAAEPGTPLGRLPVPAATLAGPDGRAIARLRPPTLGPETVLQVAEIYPRAGRWKVRSIGQGYADGLAGLARDFGVDVAEEAAPAPPPTRAVPAPTPAPPPPVARGGDRLAGVVAATNAERARAGLVPLTVDRRLATAAQRHSADMVARDFFAHEDPDGRSVADRAVAAGYRYRIVAENIAAGQRGADEVVEGWMNSPGHRASILNPELRQIGVGYAEGGDYGTYWTQVFGRSA